MAVEILNQIPIGTTVAVWSKPACVQCTAVKRAFTKAGVDFVELNLPDYPVMIERFKAVNLTSAPVVIATGHKPFAGYQPDAVAAIVAEYGTAA